MAQTMNTNIAALNVQRNLNRSSNQWYVLLEAVNQHYQAMVAATEPYHQQVKQQLVDLRQKVNASDAYGNP